MARLGSLFARNRVGPLFVVLLVLSLLFGVATPVSAQATRSWVSGVGDDANPCTRTAPCKTFAGAISKTAAGGEINCLDPGGFGAVTITKSITIDCTDVQAGVLVSGTNGIVVSTAAADVVVLRHLDINGLNTGINGISFAGAGTLFVEDVRIYGFTQQGIFFKGTGGGQLYVKDSFIRNNRVGGIEVAQPTSGGNQAEIDNTRVENNGFNGSNSGWGIKFEGGAHGSIRNSTATGNAFCGFIAQSSASLSTTMQIEDSIASENLGMTFSCGIISDQSPGQPAIVRISGNTVEENFYGLLSIAGAQIISFGSNNIGGNLTSDGAPTSTTPPR